ncbi:hypothetical protein NDU88_004070 [Pleurodeles waltl]|uniref:Uncharacterized protein n=1 Tax=Pleurodeles waltl TaxID=8319 RepID=A0AAV7VJM5_PLEWA|nr:hypothetical protein NDU88_004070 [Pleurodeles waltl]
MGGSAPPFRGTAMNKEKRSRRETENMHSSCSVSREQFPGRSQTSKPFLRGCEWPPLSQVSVALSRCVTAGPCGKGEDAGSLFHGRSAAVLLPRAATAGGIGRDPAAGGSEPGTVVTVHTARDGVLYVEPRFPQRALSPLPARTVGGV